MDEPERGMIVMEGGRQVGTVDEVIYEATGPGPRVVVQHEDGQTMLLQPGTFEVHNRVLHLGKRANGFETVVLNDPASTDERTLGDIDQTVLPVIQEEAHVERRITERGGVRVHKQVREREEVIELPTFHEEVTVERIPLGRPIETEIGSRQDGDTLIIPVLEEMLVVEKRLVLKEEIHITRRRVTETEQARIMLRSEHIDIEALDSANDGDQILAQRSAPEHE